MSAILPRGQFQLVLRRGSRASDPRLPLVEASSILPRMAEAGDAPGGAGSAQDADDVVVMEIEDSIDLHTFAPRDIPDVVDSYLEAAAEAGLEEVRVIHGRGTGFQRNRVWQLLEGHPLVTAFRNAPATRGGWGATVVNLRVGEATGRGSRG